MSENCIIDGKILGLLGKKRSVIFLIHTIIGP